MSNHADLNLGSLIAPSNTEAVRDAIHVAIAPVYAAERIAPGAHIQLDKKTGMAKNYGGGKSVGAVGIADPFLQQYIMPGERFWLFLYPNTVTSLRHHWSHPVFDKLDQLASEKKVEEKKMEELAAAPSKQAIAIAQIQSIADGLDIGYDSLMEAAESYLNCGEYLCDGGRYEGTYLPDAFWDHYEVVTGKKVDSNDRGSFFSCAC